MILYAISGLSLFTSVAIMIPTPHVLTSSLRTPEILIEQWFDGFVSFHN